MSKRILWGVLLSSLFVPGLTLAESIIPWPWIETNRYDTWKQQRDDQRADWYARRALDPVGSRRRYINGKFWPPFPRPEGLSMLPSHRFHAAHYWPLPYVCADRQIVKDFSNIQEENGWIDATTLYEYHFDDDDHSLNRAGHLQLKWIIRTTPLNRRVVYVQAADDASATTMRLTSVTEAVHEVLGVNDLPPIVPRITLPLGRSAGEVDMIQQGDRRSQPAPRISSPLQQTGGGGGSGGGM